MEIADLEEALEELLEQEFGSSGFEITTNRSGEIVILTGLKKDSEGELVPAEVDEEDDDDDEDVIVASFED